MIKAIKYSLGVMFFLWLVQTTIQHYMKEIKTGEVGKINRILFTDETFDITFWGSSTAQNYFNDSLIGKLLNKTVFNFGINGTSFDQYQGLLEAYIEKADLGQLVVISLDIHGLIKRKALYQPYYYIHTFSNDLMYYALKAVDYEYVWKGRYVPFYQLTQYGKHNLTLIKKEIFKENQFESYGFYPQNKVWSSAEVTSDTSLKLDSAYANPIVLNNLKNIIEMGLAKGLKICVVTTPLFYEAKSTLRGLDVFNKVLKDFNRSGCFTLNYLNDDLCKEKGLFFNNTHLNGKGADLFSEKISQDLKNYLK